MFWGEVFINQSQRLCAASTELRDICCRDLEDNGWDAGTKPVDYDPHDGDEWSLLNHEDAKMLEAHLQDLMKVAGTALERLQARLKVGNHAGG